jgi:myo-inositol-1(or 4)-monophosphatase
VANRTQLKDCLISTGFPFRPGDHFQTFMQMLQDVMPRVAGVRRPGAAALDLAYIAAGFADGFFETGLSPWDVAAGSLLVTEAGGLIGNFTGEADFLEQKECMAANPRIYGQMVGLLGKYSKFAAAGEKAAVRQALGAQGHSNETDAAEPNAAGDAPSPDSGKDDAPF